MATIKTCTCAQCGVRFETTHKRKYCSKPCLWRLANEKRGKRSRAEQRKKEYERTHRECPECRQMFKKSRHDSHSKGPQVYCSISCRHAEANRRKAVDDFIARERRIYRQWAQASKPQRVGNTCNDCGLPVAKSAQRCEACKGARRRDCRKRARLSPSYRAGKARSKALRRQRRRNARVETFDPFEVFERDGWRCHMCNRKTPKRLRGTYEDNAPELDHIITLAEGGEHSRRNTACACRKCNIAKVGKSQGQMRLVA